MSRIAFYLIFASLGVAFAACDTSVPLPEQMPRGQGTFTALLNGEPWEAEVDFSVRRAGLYLLANRPDPSVAAFYDQTLSVTVPGDRPEIGTYSLELRDGPPGSGGYGGLVTEADGDALMGAYVPIGDVTEAFEIIEIVNPEGVGETGRFRATLEVTFVTEDPDGVTVDGPGPQFPDTLRFTDGVIETEFFLPEE